MTVLGHQYDWHAGEDGLVGLDRPACLDRALEHRLAHDDNGERDALLANDRTFELAHDLALRGVRVGTMGVALTDATVGAVDQELGALVAGDGTGLIDGGGLSIVNRGGALSPGAPYGPAIVTRDNMLISLGHLGNHPATADRRKIPAQG